MPKFTRIPQTCYAWQWYAPGHAKHSPNNKAEIELALAEKNARIYQHQFGGWYVVWHNGRETKLQNGWWVGVREGGGPFISSPHHFRHEYQLAD